MKKCILTILCLTLALSVSSQTSSTDVIMPAKGDKEFDNGSSLVFPSPLNHKKIDDLDLLGRLWGFMKYHHPVIGKGNYNWDYELFRILPAYLNAKNDAERDAVLLGWIAKYGEIAAGAPRREVPQDAYLKPDLSWVEKLSGDLQKKVREIYANRHQGEHYYIGMVPNIGHPAFSNENPYSDMPYPDAGFRLLSLYRYWNMIQYFFPYKYETDKDWNQVLTEYIPVFLSAKDELEYELAALKVIGEVCDTHAILRGGNRVDSLRGNNFAPFQVRFVEGKPVVTDYYNPEHKESSEVEIGDVITHIGGRSIESIVDSLAVYYPASNQSARLRDISFNLLRSNDDTVAIRYVSSGVAKQKELKLYPGDDLNIYYLIKIDKSEKCYKLLDGNIGYVTLANINTEDVPVIKELFRDTKGIIIDIRNYPSAFMPFSLGPYFVSEDTPFVKFTRGSVDNPGLFALESLPLSIPKADETYRGKLVVIVNEISQSQSEYTTMAFRAGDNTTVIGSQTAGADGNMSNIVLPGGLYSAISGVGVYYPDGTKTQRIGIVPDIKVEPTVEGIKQGRDELLEKAIEIIENL